MALTFVAGPAKVGVTTTTTGVDPAATASGTGTSASATYSAGARVVLLVGANGPSTANTATPKFSVSSVGGTAGLSFARVAQSQVQPSGTGGGFPNAEIWTATAPAGGVTGTVTVTVSGGAQLANGDNATFSIVSFTDVGTPTIGVTGTANAASGAPSLALSGLTVGSFVLAAVGDWAAAGTSATETPGTGQTAIADGWVSGAYAAHLWRTTAAITGTTQTMNLTAPTAENYNMVAVEIRAQATAVVGLAPVRRVGKRR